MKSQSDQTPGQTTDSSDSGSWQLKFVLAVISIGVLGLLGKALGLF